MLQTKVTWIPGSEDVQVFEGTCFDGTRLTTSARLNATSKKTHPSPKEAVAIGHSACSAIDVVLAMRKARQPLEGLSVLESIEQTDEHPTVFREATLEYRAQGSNISAARLAHAIWNSFMKYCGVNAMLMRSGCQIQAIATLNDAPFDLFDPDGERAKAFLRWRAQALQGARRVALLLGASRGLGRALAEQLEQENFATISIHRGPLESPCCTHEFSVPGIDLTIPFARKSALSFLKTLAGSIDAFIFNAGILDEQNNPPSLMPSTELRRVFDTNFFSTVEAAQEFLPLAATNATALFLSSRMAFPQANEFNAASYRLSKASLTLFAQLFAAELRTTHSTLAVASVHPGSLRTSMNPGGKLAPESVTKPLVDLLSEQFHSIVLENNGAFWSLAEDGLRFTRD